MRPSVFAVLGLFVAQSLFAADAPVPLATGQSPAEGARASGTTSPTGAPRGPRGGRGGAPLTAEEQAGISHLSDLPPWQPGAGDGDYSIAPPYTPAAETTARDNVPKGKVVTFTMD